MKLNRIKTGTLYSCMIGPDKFEYGWYDSGRAFVAKNDEIMSYAEAFKELVPKNSFNRCYCFYVGLNEYPKTISGIVRYMSDTHNRD